MKEKCTLKQLNKVENSFLSRLAIHLLAPFQFSNKKYKKQISNTGHASQSVKAERIANKFLIKKEPYQDAEDQILSLDRRAIRISGAPKQ